MSGTTAPPRRIAVTGATGYVGGRLVATLLDRGHEVTCIAREPRKLDERPWRDDPRISIARSDLSDADHLAGHLAGCGAAYYLVHSMQVSGDAYAERDRRLADVFARAAAAAGVGRIVYLGGLGEMGDGLSEHLASRREVERVLASTGVPVTVFRAAMIIGAGSASFEILRYLVERLPVMLTPSWVSTESQPIAIADVIHWLARCLEVPETAGRTLEIGGADVLTYRALMEIMAEELALPKRLIVPLPVLTPRLSSGWISLVTPVSYRIARPLADGLRNRVVVTCDDARRLMPHEPMGVREAIRSAIESVRAHDVETRWSVAGPVPGDPDWAGGTVFVDERSIDVAATPARVFAAICRVGGGHGWYAGDLLWRVRGWMDTLVGGPGLRRGRRHPERVEFGEALDFWRVVGIDPDRSLSLLAEMRLPGVAMLQFDLAPPDGDDRTRLAMTARFRPRGMLGILYWYAVLPLHSIVFGGMLKGIKRAAEADDRSGGRHDRGDAPGGRAGYGRARLWLGMTTVGTIVTAAALMLGLGVPARLETLLAGSRGGDVLAILAFVLGYAALHAPFDVLGGYVLPRRHGRAHPPLRRYLARLARGVAAQSAVLLLVGLALLAGGRVAGAAGLVGAGMLASLALLLVRVPLARITAPLRPADAPAGGAVPTACVASEDEGFTGGIVGVLRARRSLLPARWREALGTEGFRLAQRRRDVAVRTGAWLRGRLAALAFTWTGLVVAAWATRSAEPGTARAVMELSLAFTLWSFAGLLVLPSLSRAAVAAIDERLRRSGVDPARLDETVERLDALQDAEPSRPALVEAIFHPIPSVRSRREGPRRHGVRGCWDVARSAVYLSAAGLGLLGRAVHCNCGRPALWVFLPSD